MVENAADYDAMGLDAVDQKKGGTGDGEFPGSPRAPLRPMKGWVASM